MWQNLWNCNILLLKKLIYFGNYFKISQGGEFWSSSTMEKCPKNCLWQKKLSFFSAAQIFIAIKILFFKLWSAKIETDCRSQLWRKLIIECKINKYREWSKRKSWESRKYCFVSLFFVLFVFLVILFVVLFIILLVILLVLLIIFLVLILLLLVILLFCRFRVLKHSKNQR